MRVLCLAAVVSAALILSATAADTSASPPSTTANEGRPRIAEWRVELFNSLSWYEDTRHYALSPSRPHIEALLTIMNSNIEAKDPDRALLGIALLHKHFELRDDEVVLERIQPGRLTITTRARPATKRDGSSNLTKPNQNATPYVFRVVSHGGLEPLEFVANPEKRVRRLVRRLNSGSLDLLVTRFHEYLCRHNLTEAYGIGVAHRHQVAAADPHGRLIETSNLEAGWQMILPFNAQSTEEVDRFHDNQDKGLATNTFWELGNYKPHVATNGSLDCYNHCNHCTAQ
jgi:hypothetical protein